ncbi:MAG: hypothetical protein AAB446_00920 [Patescibacteria group bacterium]
MKLLSGPQIFLRYAFRPCAEEKMKAGKIDKCSYERMEVIIEENDVPPILLLEKCFPNAVTDYKRFCLEFKRKDNFSRESVINYWRYNHDGPTPVKHAIVCMIDDNGIVKVISDGEAENAINPYKLILRKEDLVFIHNSIIVEKDED